MQRIRPATLALFAAVGSLARPFMRRPVAPDAPRPAMTRQEVAELERKQLYIRQADIKATARRLSVAGHRPGVRAIRRRRHLV